MNDKPLHKGGSTLMKLLSLIMLAIAGVWIAAIIMSRWYILEVSGAFVKWNILDGPHTFQKLVNVEHFDLRARSTNGKIYAYTTELNAWQPDPNSLEQSGYLISSDCETLYWFAAVQSRYPPQEAGTPAQCGVSVSHHPLAGTVDMAYYVLLDNGKIWMWRHTRDPKVEISIFLAGLFIGLMVGIIVWFMIQERF